MRAAAARHVEMAMGLEFLESYKGQSLEELISLESQYRVDSLVLACEEALLQKRARVGREALSPEEQVVLAVEAFEREVNNGGYGQFFFNSSNEHTREIVGALETIGCPKFAATTQRAMDALELEEKELSPEAIEAVLDERGEELAKVFGGCDDDFYATTDENIDDGLFEFIKAHKSRISLR